MATAQRFAGLREAKEAAERLGLENIRITKQLQLEHSLKERCGMRNHQMTLHETYWSISQDTLHQADFLHATYPFVVMAPVACTIEAHVSYRPMPFELLVLWW